MQIVTIRLSFNVVDFRISTFHKCGFLFAIEMEGDLSIGFFCLRKSQRLERLEKEKD